MIVYTDKDTLTGNIDNLSIGDATLVTVLSLLLVTFSYIHPLLLSVCGPS